MKKISVLIITMAFLICAGCYKEDTATVRINLGNIPVAQNIQQKSVLDRIRSFFVKDAYAAGYPIYIAAVKGNKPLEVVITNTGEINNHTVEMEVPAGDGITIVVLYHWMSTGNIFYYGNATVNLEAGKEKDITIDNMIDLNGINGLNFIYNSNLHNCSWNAIPGATKFILEGQSESTSQWDFVFYEGLETTKNLPDSGYNYLGIKVCFDYFNIITIRKEVSF
jgi:hypothetical protein